MTETRPRRLVPVASAMAKGEPDGIHLSALEWVPRLGEYITGMALCGQSAEQGALPDDTPVTCQGCEDYRARHVQVPFGDAEAPIPAAPDTIPASCYWWTDPDGGLCLLPGCMARVQDPDAECTCDSLAARLAKTQEQLREMEEQQRYAEVWWFALREAVGASPCAAEILADAHRRAGR
ncbi:hypothetical protein ACIQGZ_17175 [Streptomyces sp. NPDC092296]|uniref:hypothetical protein n=1 Tax=Streptomyces sp. NPDC092296 TaxID=3366012 RepID=UPI0038267E94